MDSRVAGRAYLRHYEPQAIDSMAAYGRSGSPAGPDVAVVVYAAWKAGKRATLTTPRSSLRVRQEGSSHRYFGKTVRTFRAIELLKEEGLVEEAWILLRGAGDTLYAFTIEP